MCERSFMPGVACAGDGEASVARLDLNAKAAHARERHSGHPRDETPQWIYRHGDSKAAPCPSNFANSLQTEGF
jgi:hypothetical protein